MVSRRSARFNKCLAKLPRDIQEKAEKRYRNLFCADPFHPLLKGSWYREKVSGRAVYKVDAGSYYRALAYYDETPRERTFTWYWIGSHEEYNGIKRRDITPRQ